MWTQTAITEKLGLRYPILQAGMAGGSTTPQLVAAVSNAGGLGTLGAGYMTPQAIREAIQEIRRLTDRPFAVNLFVNAIPEANSAEVAKVQGLMRKYREELNLPEPAPLAKYGERYQEQLQVIIEERVALFSFTFGMLTAAEMELLRGAGILTCGTATTVAEAVALEENGVDLICGQGHEAGGHRGTFQLEVERSLVGTMALIPQIVDAVKVPVIAAGGIMDGRGVAAALMLGAGAAQLGTAFLTVEESGAHAVYKKAILESTDDSTALTQAFSGRYARGIRNKFLEEMAAHEADIPAYPIQNALTRDIRNAAAKQNDPSYMSLWAGQAAAMSTTGTAVELVERLVKQTNEVLGRFA
jgi:nitronate monooxygenase